MHKIQLPRILIVDDETDIAYMTRVMLESAGYEVVDTTNGEEALSLVKTESFDLILLDAVMPGMSGLDVCRRLKRNKETTSIPIIMYTALGTGIDMMLEKKDKADGYLQKPFTRSLLLEKIEEVLK